MYMYSQMPTRESSERQISHKIMSFVLKKLIVEKQSRKRQELKESHLKAYVRKKRFAPETQKVESISDENM